MVYCPECESDLDIEEDEVDEGEVVLARSVAPTSRS